MSAVGRAQREAIRRLKTGEPKETKEQSVKREEHYKTNSEELHKLSESKITKIIGGKKK